MLTGFTKFKEKFQSFEDQYVVIGGTACDLLMENENMTFRATKDIDIALIVEAVTAEFGKAFWEYVKEAEYEHKNDVFRLAQLITAESKQVLTEDIAADMKLFLDEMEKETVDLKALGIRGFNQKSIMSLLRNCYGIE